MHCNQLMGARPRPLAPRTRSVREASVCVRDKKNY